MKSTNLENLKLILDKEDDFLILMHSKPDGDAIGSAYALLLYLRGKNKNAFIGIEEELFDKYKYFVDNEDYKNFFIRISKIRKINFNKIVIVDCAALHLLGHFRDMVEQNQDKCLVIDHHYSTAHFDFLGYIEAESSSTSEIIISLLEKEEMSFLMAQALYMGMVFDTGQFRFSSTTASVFQKVALLLEKHPINLEKVYFLLFENERVSRKKVIGALVDHIDFYCNGEIAVAYLSKEMLNKLRKENVPLIEDDLIDLVNVPHSIKGVVVSVLVREKDNEITFSFRSRGQFNVNDVASEFGGGGHKKAAGLKIPYIALDEVKSSVISRLVEEYEKDV